VQVALQEASALAAQLAESVPAGELLRAAVAGRRSLRPCRRLPGCWRAPTSQAAVAFQPVIAVSTCHHSDHSDHHGHSESASAVFASALDYRGSNIISCCGAFAASPPPPKRRPPACVMGPGN